MYILQKLNHRCTCHFDSNNDHRNSFKEKIHEFINEYFTGKTTMLCIECKKYEVESSAFVNQPKDTCFDCWFKRDIASDEVKPFFTNKEVRKILLIFGSILTFGGFIIGYLLGLST